MSLLETNPKYGWFFVMLIANWYSALLTDIDERDNASKLDGRSNGERFFKDFALISEMKSL